MRVLVVDDDRLVSSSLKTILEADGDIEVVGTGGSGSQAIALYSECRPDILLMDIRMDGMTGIEVAEILLKRDPDAKILFLTTFSDDDYIIKALRIGAKGYLLKQNFESIVPSIKTVAIGQRVFGDEIITRIPAMLSGSPKDDFKEFGLSEKETEILTQVANGLSNKEIAETLFLSEGTVRNYISVILEKLGLRDRTQLAIFYYKHS
ncbi:response regulator [Caproiciproducens sp. R1]|uniref:response regulator n=1 Tax=Caproiciproducens sp. R1 TaxID=3435000 RepID=UPI00403383F8